MRKEIRQADEDKSTSPASPQSQRRNRALPKRSAVIQFYGADGRVFCEVELTPELFAAVRGAARKARCSVLTFIKRAIEAKLAALEEAQRSVSALSAERSAK
ncbi:hypothetical protein GC207_11320 [bacterium]|nr:hypothetical protein [bacterium]